MAQPKKRFGSRGSSVAVYSFANLGRDPDEEYIRNGITEDVTTELSRSPRIFVISRSSSFTYEPPNIAG